MSANREMDAIETQDRRVKRTQRLLAQALIALTLERGYDTVTIRDITERADIGYATFFRHYHDKDALLADVLQVVLEELLVRLQPQHTNGSETDPAEVGRLIFEYIDEHSEVCRVLLGSQGPASLVRRVIEEGAQRVVREHTPRQGGLVPVEIAANHVVAATIALIQWWLDHEMPHPPQRMGKIYAELIYHPASVLSFDDYPHEG
ncbi:MAG: TetR/AcrR family transcriptional regulator [Ktedonobacterales bacterium]